MTLRLVVLISGKGSNLQAIQAAIEQGLCDARIAAVVSDRAAAQGLSFASEHGLPIAVVSMHDYAQRAAWDDALTRTVAELEPDLIVLAGFMRVLGAPFIERFARRVINVHPALLPLFPGTKGPADAIAAGVRVSGCTVHLVDNGVDTGPIIAQGVVRVVSGDTPERLHARIQRAEHVLFPQVIAAIARHEITLSPTVVIHAQSADDTSMLLAPAFDDGSS